MKFQPLLATAAVIGALAAPTIAFAADDGKPVVTKSPGKATATQTRSVTATVTEVDVAKRTLTVKGPDGQLHPMAAGPEVRNLDKVKVGDSMVVRYRESLSLTLKKDGKELPGATGGVAVARAASGAQPAGGVMGGVEIIANVTAMDDKTQIVTLKGAERTVEMHVKDPAQYKLIKVGDQIQAVYTQELAIAIEPAKKK